MSITPVLPILFAQEFGPSAKIASDAVTRPELAQAMNKVVAEHAIKQEQKQIQKTQEGSKGLSVSDDSGQNQNGQNFFNRENNKEKEELDQEKSEQLGAFVGKFVNKVI